MSPIEGLIEFCALFKLGPIDSALFQQLLGCLAAFGAHRVNLKHQPRSATDWQTNKSFIFSHGISIAITQVFTIWRAADMRVGVSLTTRCGKCVRLSNLTNYLSVEILSISDEIPCLSQAHPSAYRPYES